MSENMKNETVQGSEVKESKKVTSTEKSGKSEKSKVASKPKKDNVFKKLANLFKGSWREMKNVTWSNPRSTTMNSILVVVALILVGAIFGALDLGFSSLISFIIKIW